MLIKTNSIKMKSLIIYIGVLLITTSTIFAQTKNEKIDALLNDYYKKGMFNGSVIVSENGKPIYKNGFGYANFEWYIKNDPNTKFKIGSCTKSFTAVLIMILNEEGKIGLDDKIIKYIPEYPADKGNKISIVNLLNHTSGIPEYIILPKIQTLQYMDNDPKEFIKNFWDLDLEFEPGTQLKYSNSGYFLLGVIIEKITGKTYAQVLQEKILEPLAMNNSGVINDHYILSKKAYGYVKTNEGLKLAPYVNATGAFSAGAMYSTVEDLLKWQNALQENKILSKESTDKMLQPTKGKQGLGFGILDITLRNGDKKLLYGHEGMFYGFRSLIHIFKEDNNSIILLDNNQNSDLFEISSAIREVLYE